MSPQAPTPAPHTPVLFLKSGGSAFFSADCQEALIRVAINPDWFGDHDTVSARLRAAKIKIAEWDARTPEEQRKQPEARPTPEDRFFAACTASHLVQDAVYRAARAPDRTPGRGNPCASLVDGYTEGTAPAFPGSGSATNPRSVEGALTVKERIHRRAQAHQNQPSFDVDGAGLEPSPNTYPAKQIRADEDARSRTLVSRQRPGWNKTMRDLRRAGLSSSDTPILVGSGPSGRAATPEERARFAEAVGARAAAKPTSTTNEVIEGRTAADCINQWRERAKGEMMTTGLRAEIERTEQEATRQGRAAALAALRQAEADVSRRSAEERAARAGSAHERRARAAADAARLRRKAARAAFERVESAASRLPCLRAMQKRLREGGGRSDGRTFA